MPIGWKVSSITFFDNMKGSNNTVSWADDKEPIICIHEDDTKIIVKREGDKGFIKQYPISNIFEINWEEPIDQIE